MSTRIPITEYLDIDLESEMWCCNRCGVELISARDNYKKGCLVWAREDKEIHRPLDEESQVNFCVNPEWMLIVELYCPKCGTMIECEYLPPGHPLTHDIELDIDKLRVKYLGRKGQ